MTRQLRTAYLVETLPRLYPDARCDLSFGNPLELLVATILSAQCTDKRVNLVTAELFQRCRTAHDYAGISQEELEGIVRTTGFYRNKAKNLRLMAAELVASHAGEVPPDMETMRNLPGVGRKTANVVLGNAFGRDEGVVVDTHVGRLSERLGLTTHTDAEKIEADLVKLVPRPHWTIWSHWLIAHGRARCTARSPDCAGCELHAVCPTGRKVIGNPAATRTGAAKNERRKARGSGTIGKEA